MAIAGLNLDGAWSPPFVFIARTSLGLSSSLELNGAIVGLPVSTRLAEAVDDYFYSNGMGYQSATFDDLDDLVAAFAAGRVDVLVVPQDSIEPALFPAMYEVLSGAIEDDGRQVWLTEESDAWTGSETGQIAYGLGGNDSLHGAQGDDLLWGGDGNDLLSGDAGNDMLWGDLGRDALRGGGGLDTLDGGGGKDRLYGGALNDELLGGGGHDRLYGDGGNDLQYGGGGADTLFGGGASDEIYGDAGNDRLSGGGGSDGLFGGAGDDILVGGAGLDALVGGDGNDMLRTGPGGGVLVGGNGHDVVYIDGQFSDYEAYLGNPFDEFRYFLLRGEDTVTGFFFDLEVIHFADRTISGPDLIAELFADAEALTSGATQEQDSVGNAALLDSSAETQFESAPWWLGG